MKGSKDKFQFSLIVLLLLLLFWGGSTQLVHAAIKTPDDFMNASWSLVASVDVLDALSWSQGSCTTEDYIIISINATDQNDSPDTIVALYKNAYDENGEPVEQYSVAKKVTQRDYEHANGMAYNPHTKEIAIAGYTSRNPENKASLFIIDSTTLEYKRTVQLNNPGFDLLGIDYMPEQDQYMLQTSGDGRNIFFITDAEFNYVRTLDASLPSNTIGSNFQDFCVSGDYIVTTPLMLGVSNQQYLEIFSIKDNSFYGRYELNLPIEAGFIEPESICELSPGEIMVMVPTDAPRKVNIFTVTLPAICKVETSVSNGTITETNAAVDIGSTYTIGYEPEKNYGLESLVVDGVEQEVSRHQKEYTFSLIDGNHTVSAVFEKLPKYKIDTEVTRGSIDTPAIIQKGDSLTISYKAKKHFAIGKVLIDGKKVKTSQFKNSYTFENIEKPHSISVIYRWKYIPFVVVFIILIIVWLGVYYRAVIIRRRKKVSRRQQERFITRMEKIEYFD